MGVISKGQRGYKGGGGERPGRACQHCDYNDRLLSLEAAQTYYVNTNQLAM